MAPLVLFAEPRTAEEIGWIQNLIDSDEMRVVAPGTSDRDELLELARDSEFIVTKSVQVDAEIIRAAKKLRLVQKYGSYRDKIDIQTARELGVMVATMPLLGCVAVAELVMTMVLALSKCLLFADSAVRSGVYEKLDLRPKLTSERSHAFQWANLWNVTEVWGESIGIVGLGEIGVEVSRRARAFGMKIWYWKRTRLALDQEAELGVEWCDTLDSLLKQCRFVSLNVPHTEATTGLIGARELQLMREDAYLVNTSRGGVVDEDALYASLSAGRIAGAGLDVYVYEPLPKESPLLTLDKVILTPHIGGGSGRGNRERQMRDVLGNISRVIAEKEPEWRVC
jgi:phosphoglycerate dehydrogenase-like enzyme